MVGLLLPDLGNKAVERRDAGLRLASPEQLGAMNIPDQLRVLLVRKLMTNGLFRGISCLIEGKISPPYRQRVDEK